MFLVHPPNPDGLHTSGQNRTNAPPPPVAGVLIEAWKVSKACVASVAWWGWVPVLRLEDRESYASEHRAFPGRPP